MDGEAWQSTAHGVPESDMTEWLHFHFQEEQILGPLWTFGSIYQWSCLVLDSGFLEVCEYCFNLLTSDPSIQIFYFFKIPSWKVDC